MTLESFLAAWCTALSLSFVWPQVWRCMRHDTTHGISAFATLHGVTGSALWLVYGVMSTNTAMWFSNASFITAQALISSVLIRHGRLAPQMMRRFAALAGALLLVGLVMSQPVLGWIAIVVSGSGMIPNVIHVRRSPSLHAVSILSWSITILSAMSWTVYGLVIHDPIIQYVNYFTIPLMMYVIVKAARWRAANGHPVFGRVV